MEIDFSMFCSYRTVHLISEVDNKVTYLNYSIHPASPKATESRRSSNRISNAIRLFAARYVYVLATLAHLLNEGGIQGMGETNKDQTKPRLDQIKLQKFWEEINRKGPQAAEQLLGQVIKTHPEIAHIVNDLKISIDKVTVQARNTHDGIQKFIGGKNITMESVFTLLLQELGKIYEDLKDEVGGPSLNGHRRDSGAARDRAQFVSQVMEKVETVYIRVLTEVGVPRDVAETQFSGFSLLITRVVLVASQIIDKHPFLLSISNLVVSIHLSGLSCLPLMRLILPLLGFDPLGPVKGTIFFIVGSVAKLGDTIASR